MKYNSRFVPICLYKLNLFSPVIVVLGKGLSGSNFGKVSISCLIGSLVDFHFQCWVDLIGWNMFPYFSNCTENFFIKFLSA